METKIQNLRKKYPKFIYKNYSYRISKNNLEILFDFKIEPGIYFKPKIIIENINKSRLKKIGNKVLNNLIFHLGLAEIPSYWKATCSSKIEIKAGFLNKEEIKWWKDLIIQGLGQFFYENKINFTHPNFFKIIINKQAESNEIKYYKEELKNGVLVPVSGGKDSIVTLEILEKAKKNTRSFSLNPTEAAQKIMKIKGCKRPIIVRRKIDKRLLELNRKKFLNGHTPFSSYLSFLSVILAVIFDYKYIAFSQERSSNEGNIKYLRKTINHQYSKSFDFEKKFKNYSKKYLIKNVEYFSFLRPIYEIQIVKLFSNYPKYFFSFLSCNEAYKTVSGTKKPTKKWCGNCSKCLFVWSCLYPFIDNKKLSKIFGKNLFQDKKLLYLMKELIGEQGTKPFECVGTKKESLVAFYLSWKKAKKIETDFFKLSLLKYFEEKVLSKHSNLENESKKMINSWNNQNNLPKEFEKILKKVVS